MICFLNNMVKEERMR